MSGILNPCVRMPTGGLILCQCLSVVAALTATQALGDAMTIIERKGQLEGLRIAIVGDVEHSRVARSNAWLLSKMGAEVRFVGPRTLIPPHAMMLPGFAGLASPAIGRRGELWRLNCFN